MYYGILDGKLDSVFLEEPPQGVLQPADEVFPPVDLKGWIARGPDGPGVASGSGDADERTYLATQVLPGGRGAFGYLAVSMAKGEPHWVRPADQKGQSTETAGGAGAPGWRRTDPQATSTPLQPDPEVSTLHPAT